MTPIKKTLGIVVIVLFLAAWGILAMGDKSIEHIEDTNGPEDYSLQTLNDGNIISRDVGAKGFSSTTDNLTQRVVYSSKKFSGVTEVEGYNVVSKTYTVYLNFFDLNGGNAKLVVMKDDTIVHEFKPNEGSQVYTVEDAKGSYVSLRLAGESAKFRLEISQ